MRTSEAATAVTGQRDLGPTSSASRRGSEYAQLSRQIKEAGLLERRGGITPGRSRPPPWRWPPDGPCL